jgi:hypothetical protein
MLQSIRLTERRWPQSKYASRYVSPTIQTSVRSGGKVFSNGIASDLSGAEVKVTEVQFELYVFGFELTSSSNFTNPDLGIPDHRFPIPQTSLVIFPDLFH